MFVFRQAELALVYMRFTPASPLKAAYAVRNLILVDGQACTAPFGRQRPRRIALSAEGYADAKPTADKPYLVNMHSLQTSGRRERLRPGETYAAKSLSGIKWLSASYCRPQSMVAMPRRAACGLAPPASHRAMNWGGTSTNRTLDGWNFGLGLDMTELRFARQPLWPPLANPIRITRRRVKVCTATRLNLDAPSTMREWDDNGGHTYP